MPDRSKPASIDEYVGEFPPATRKVLEEIRALVRSIAPQAVETMSYGIPTFDIDKKHLVHFAGFANHVGFYPTPSAIEAFRQEIKGYTSAKGSVQFPLDHPMPIELIRRMVEFRVSEMESVGKRK